MAALNLKEIASAQAGDTRDQFELFAREFLELHGFTIVVGPDRGADAGKDMIVSESRTGPGGTSNIRWLVSCKHKAHSGSSVSPTDEGNIRDRIETHDCNGFIAFYSTVLSSGLATNLNALKPKFEVIVYDNERIERQLLARPEGRVLAARFMPLSYNAWMQRSVAVERPRSRDPQLIRNTFFLREPHKTLDSAIAEAAARKALVFVVIYDSEHPTRSKLNYSLGYFMEYQATKRLVDENFVPVVGSSKDSSLAALVPSDDPLENCRWVVLDETGQVLHSEGVYANPDEGLKRVRAQLAKKSSL